MLVLLLLSVLSVVAMPSAAPQPAPQSAAPLAAAQGVLDARVAALNGNDKAGFLATIDPEAPAAFKEAQSRLFDGLRSLPLASYALEARTAESGDLSRRGTGTFLPETRQRMRIRDYDATDAVDSLWLTFVQRRDRWYIGADNDLADLGIDTARGLWDFGPVVAQPTEHFLLLSHPDQAGRAQAIGALAEQAAADLSRRWTQPWPGRVPLVLPSSMDELAAIIQSTVDLTKFVAFVSYGAVRDRGHESTAPRIYIQDRNLSTYGRRFQTETLVHELNHAAMAGLSGPFIPAWVHEGVADWVATGQRLNERKPSSDHSHVPRDHSFSTGSQGSIVRSYVLSRSAVSWLAGAKGMAAPGTFIRALGEVRIAPGSVDYQVDAALRRSAGMGVADLESIWAR
jgi:hypothetical protein